jgi:hypothetical protein
MTDRAHVQVSRDEHQLLPSIRCEETQSVLISRSSELQQVVKLSYRYQYQSLQSQVGLYGIIFRKLFYLERPSIRKNRCYYS